jgi:predicted O-linked N-acetylglucosamine transferase (SPINDLY family)
MLNEEQQYINIFFQRLQTDFNSVESLIPEINKRFKGSIALQYYIGYYYEKSGNIQKASQQFKYCIQLAPRFTHPYFHLANYLLRNERVPLPTSSVTDPVRLCGKVPELELEKLLLPIFGKPTMDLTNTTKSRKAFNLSDQVQIVNMLGPVYMQSKNYPKAIKIYKKALEFLEDHSSNNPGQELEQFRETCLLALGEATTCTDPDQSFYYYNQSSKNKKMFNSAVLGIHYAHFTKDTLIKETLKLIKTADELYKSPYTQLKLPQSTSSRGTSTEGDGSLRSIFKIKLGIMSPDLNKNAVGLFARALLLNFDAKVTVYYTNLRSDKFTSSFKTLVQENGGEWVEAGMLDDQTLFNKMRFESQLDILIDLIGPGSMNKLELIAMKPADIIINYLGYPGTGYLKEYTHRIVDNFTDPQTSDNFHESLHTEKLIRLPRFLNFSLFDGIELPSIEDLDKHEIAIGVMNKWSKFHPVILDAWKQILDANDSIVLYIKRDSPDSISDPPFEGRYKNRIKVLPFYENLEEYLRAFNRFHICLDTFPYSGTTTTCTSLLMGVPVFTVYDPYNNPHVSNVSGSILKTCKLDQFLCQNLDDYMTKVLNYIQTTLPHIDSVGKGTLPHIDSVGKGTSKMARTGSDTVTIGKGTPTPKPEIRKAFIENMTNSEEFGKDFSDALYQNFI